MKREMALANEAMDAAEEVQFCLKVMMMRESNKVLYAEVDNDFADVLLSFLTLPLGTIGRLLIKHYGHKAPIIGSLNSLYAGLLNLDSCHFWTKEGKLMLLNPRNSFGFQCSRLKLPIDDTPPATQCFTCENFTCASMYYKMACGCLIPRNSMTGRELKIDAQSEDKSGFTAQTASFLLTDDLQILTNTSTSLFQILKLNGIGDTSVLEERTLFFGLKEIMELLKGSLVSQTPITDIILSISSAAGTLNKRQKLSALTKYEPDALPQTSENVSSDSKKITLKALVQKSTHRVLLAQTQHDFIDFLFSLLIIPLGRVQFLLGSNTCLGSINNLYRSVSNWKDVDYMKSRETINALLDPQIPPYYLSSYQIISLNQQSASAVHSQHKKGRCFYTTTPDVGSTPMKMIDPKGHDSFVKGRTMYMVTDDLVVSTPSSAFIISTLNRMKIPVSDVEEQELDIGIEEALNILKASLSSTSALSDGLKPFLKRRPEQERRSEIYKRNRHSEPAGVGTGMTKHTTCSRSFVDYNNSMRAELGREPNSYELFYKTHTNKAGDFVDDRSKSVNAAFQARRDVLTASSGASSSQTNISNQEINQLYLSVVGVQKGGTVYGLGTQASGIYPEITSQRGSPTNNRRAVADMQSKWEATEEKIKMVEEKIQRVEEDNAKLRDRIDLLEVQVQALVAGMRTSKERYVSSSAARHQLQTRHSSSRHPAIYDKFTHIFGTFGDDDDDDDDDADDFLYFDKNVDDSDDGDDDTQAP